MVPELEKPRVLEIQVRMDCNGCVQKIKKALHGINGIYDLYIDFPQQKLIIIGWADPEKILKAIKKTRKIIGSVCVHTEESEQPPQAAEPPPEGSQPAAPDTSAPTTESTPPQTVEVTPEAEPPKDPPPPENPAIEYHPSHIAMDATSNPPVVHHPGSKDIEQVHVIHHHQHEYTGHVTNYPAEGPGHWSNYPQGQGQGSRPEPPVYVSHSYNTQGQGSRPEPPVYVSHGYNTQGQGSRPEPPVYVSHSYNTHRPSPHVSEYEYARSPPRQTHYSRAAHYYPEDYQVRENSSSSGNNITSIFSDENPNACRIV